MTDEDTSRDPAERLEEITTRWSMVFEAHRGTGDARVRAQAATLERYFGAVLRYLYGAVREPHQAEELAQEFVVEFLRGAFHRADRERGRFRDYVRTSLRHMLADHFSKRTRETQKKLSNVEWYATFDADFDADFADRWRTQLLECAWSELRQLEEKTNTRYYSALRARTENPSASIEEIAAVLQAADPATNAVQVRQLIHRARRKFAEFLVAEVERSIGDGARDHLTDELAELDLLQYCHSVLSSRTKDA